MKQSSILGVVVTLGAILVAILRQQSQSPSAKAKAPPSIVIRHGVASSELEGTTGAGMNYSPVQPKTVDALTARAEAYVLIDEASVTYDERAVAAIAPHLANADLEIRKLALDGLLRAGEVTAASVLRIAATKLADPREAATFLDAADFLELPPMNRIKKSVVPAPEQK